MADALSYIGLKQEKRQVEKEKAQVEQDLTVSRDTSLEDAAKEIERDDSALAERIRQLKSGGR